MVEIELLLFGVLIALCVIVYRTGKVFKVAVQILLEVKRTHQSGESSVMREEPVPLPLRLDETDLRKNSSPDSESHPTGV